MIRPPLRQRGMTLIEAAVAMGVFSIVGVGVLALIQNIGSTSSMVYSATTAQVEAERVLRLVRQELQVAGPTSLADPTQGYEFFSPPTAGAGSWEILYRKLEPMADIFDESDANPVQSAPWSANRFSLRFEPEETGAADGVDNDGDYLVDEGQVILRNASTGATVAILGRDITDFVITRSAIGGSAVRERLSLAVTVERVLAPAVTESDHGTLKSGGGPRARHTARLDVVLNN